MFTGFFYLLRARGFHVTLSEWMTLMEALTLGLHHCSFTGFYDLCRAVLVHSETDYDRFDSAFLEYFDGVPFPEDQLPEELMKWLKKPEDVMRDFRAFLSTADYKSKSIEEILKKFEERLREQKEEHNGGDYKVIFVGDAMMDMYELLEKRFDWRTKEERYSGMDYLKRFREQYPYLVWLNPEDAPVMGGLWGESYGKIAKVVDMYPLSVAGLERAMKKLLVVR